MTFKERDYVLKALIGERDFIAFIAKTTNLVEKARNLHSSAPTATAAFGRLLSLTGIMGIQLKGRENISVQIISHGPLKELYAQSDSKGNVRGFIRYPHVDLPPTKSGHLDVEGALGHGGMMYVLRDFGYGEPQWGAISLKTGGVATDLAYYFTVSMGIPSAVGAGVLVGKYGEVLGAGAFIVQPLPNSNSSTKERIERNISKIKDLSRLIYEGNGPEEILERIAKGLPTVILERLSLNYRCRCSKERARRALRLLGPKEIIEIINEDHKAEVVCQFCGKKYYFYLKDLKLILDDLSRENPQI